MKAFKLPTPKGNSKIALIIGGVIIIIVIFIFMGNSSTEEETTDIDGVEKESWFTSDMKKKLLVAGIAIGVLYWYFTRTEDPMTIFEIITEVANAHHDKKGMILSTMPNDIRVGRGIANEHFIEFIPNIYSVVYVEGVGVVESYPGMTLFDLKKTKSRDEIDMRLRRGLTDNTLLLNKMRSTETLPEEFENE